MCPAQLSAAAVQGNWGGAPFYVNVGATHAPTASFGLCLKATVPASCRPEWTHSPLTLGACTAQHDNLPSGPQPPSELANDHKHGAHQHVLKCPGGSSCGRLKG